MPCNVLLPSKGSMAGGTDKWFIQRWNHRMLIKSFVAKSSSSGMNLGLLYTRMIHLLYTSSDSDGPCPTNRA